MVKVLEHFLYEVRLKYLGLFCVAKRQQKGDVMKMY